jgi:PKD repeat protein
MLNGIIRGTEWTFDWGDGIIETYISAADNDMPPLAARTHTYSTTSDCNYIVSLNVDNKCGGTQSQQFIAVVHGRDIPADGDGVLEIVNNANGSPVVQVCAGTETIVTLRDNSTWNCQTPSLPSGFVPVPNTDTRNLEWLYGRDPSGNPVNTITGTVSIASLGNAPQASGRFEPSPNAPGSLSQAITIPATAQPGETFRVYLKNWNKCNPGDDEYVFTYVDIEVVASPDAPTGESRIVCVDDDRTLSVTSVPVGTITWYSDAALTNPVGSGMTYVPADVLPGIYSYYITDRELSGLLCESPASLVTLQINPEPSVPVLSGNKKNDVCYGLDTYTITASAATTPPITGYQWFKDGVLLPGRTSDTIIIGRLDESGLYTCASVGVAPTFCLSDQSDTLRVTVHTLEDVIQPVDQIICEDGTAVFMAITTEEIASWQWERSYDGGLTFSTVSNSAPYDGFNTSTLTMTTPGISYDGSYYRVEMKTPQGQGGCAFKSEAALLTVNGLPSVSAGPDIALCTPTPYDPIPMTGTIQGGSASSVVWSGGETLGTWTQNSNAALATFTPSVPEGSFTALITITGTDACGNVIVTGTRNITWSETPAVDAGADIERCDDNSMLPIVMTGSSVTGSYSVLSWTGGAGLGTWTQSANPAFATFTPSVPSGSFTATLAATGDGVCLGTNPSDTRIISWGETPEAVAGPAINRCDDAPLAPIVMAGATATGTYSSQIWSGGEALGTWTQNGDPAMAAFTPNVTSGSFTATITLTGMGACAGSDATATRTIEWSWEATVSAGADQSICANEDVTLEGVIGGGATTAVWTGGAGTFTPDNTTLNALYSPTQAERDANEVTLTLTTDDPAGLCGPVNDQMTIFIGTVPTSATLVSSGDWCTDVDPSWISSVISGGAPPYTISYEANGVPQPDITGYYNGDQYDLGFLPAGTYTWEITQIVDDCGNILTGAGLPLPVTFTIYENPDANAGNDRFTCGDLFTTLAAVPSVGTGTWSVVSGPGTAVFTPDANTPGATVTVSDYGSYVLRWTEINGGVCVSTSEIIADFEKVAAAGIDLDLCGSLSAGLNGNVPAVGQGTWALVSGPGTVSFTPGTHSPAAVATVSTYGTYVFSWTIDNGGLCSTTDEVTVIYNPAGQVNTPANQVVCNSDNTTDIIFSTLTATGSTTYEWTNNNTGIGLGASGTGDIVSFTAVNMTSAPVVATIEVTPTYHSGTISCPGTPVTFTITVNPTAQVNSLSDQVLCEGVTAEAAFSTNRTGGTTTYSWTNTVPGIGLPASGTGNISFTTINGGTEPLTGTITVTPHFENGGTICDGPTESFDITVNPAGQVNPPGDRDLCNNSTATINFTTVNTGGITSYEWTNDNTAIGLGSDGTGNITFLPVNNGTTPITANITVTPTFNNGARDCPGTSESFVITVYPTPRLTSTLFPDDICSNTVFSYNPTSATAGTTFNWTRADVTGILPPGPVTGTGNPGETLRNLTNTPLNVTYQYTLEADGCSNIQNVVVQVNPEPVITPDQNDDICSGNQLNHHIALENFVNPDDQVLFTWSAPVLDPVDPSFSGGMARVSASASNISDLFINTTGGDGTATYTITPYKDGCAGESEDIVFTIRSQPVMAAGLGATVCSSTPTGLILDVETGSVTADYYNITNVVMEPGLSALPGNAIISNPNAPANYLSGDRFLNITGVDRKVTYTVQPVHAPDCFGAAVNVEVTIRPQPYIIPAQTKVVCSDVPIDMEVLLSPANQPAGTLFNWDAPGLTDFSGQGTAGVNVAADPAGTFHLTDAIHNSSGSPITATYYITPISTEGCEGTEIPVVITVNPEPVPKTISGRDKICAGETNLVYGVNPTAGSSFSWTVDPEVGTKSFDFNTSSIIVDAAAVAGSGDISIFETNSYGCAGDISVFPVEVYNQAAPEDISGPVEVCAYSTQVFSVTERTGSVYSWSLPGGSAIIGNPAAASITVIMGNVGGTVSVTEANIAGCVTVHNDLSVVVRALPTAHISGGGTVCDGSVVDLNVDFTGTAPFTFTYALNGVAQPAVTTSDDPYTLAVTGAGTYTILSVSDATSCTNTGTGSALIAYYPRPTGVISGDAEMCGGSGTQLTLSFTGTPPFNFAYTDGTNTYSVTNHASQVYTTTVFPAVTTSYTLASLSDANGCDGSMSGSADITVNQPPVLTLAGTDLTCNGDNSGAIDLTIAGSSPFGVAWSGSGGFTANTEDLSGLPAGTYTVTVTDTEGCVTTDNITLTEPAALFALVASTDFYCYGGSGSITISSPSGGSGNYEFTIDGGATWSTSTSFTALVPGMYDVRMRDIAYPVCDMILDGALEITGPDELTATITPADIVCFGANNGSIVISGASGGFGTYQYSIDGGLTWQGSGNFTGLSPDSYDVRIRDAAYPTCEVVLNGAVVISEPPQLSAVVDYTDVTCNGASDGTITVSAPAGGHGSFEYSINGGGSWQSSGLYTGIAPGTYNVQIRDAAYPGCYVVLDNALGITQPSVLRGTIDASMVSCNGANDGIIEIINVSGGYGTYEYTINGGTDWYSTSLFSGLSPGSYDVRMRDALYHSCELILDLGLDITETPALSAMLTSSDITCFGAGDGSITITNADGGTGTYEYTIDGGSSWQTQNSFTGLSHGTYGVMIRDRMSPTCVLVLDPALDITEPPALSGSVAWTDVTCFNANNGTITVSSAAGGYGTYDYSINGGLSWQGSGNFINLGPGSYDVRIRDAASTGCVLIVDPNLVIIEPAALSATAAGTNVTCNGAADGTITVSGATGGYGTYEYSIDGGATWHSSGSFTNLGPGFYSVRVRDAVNTGCSVTVAGSLNITEPAVLNASLAYTDITCFGSSDGSISVSSPSGGYGTYQFTIDGGTTWHSSGSFTGLPSGSYDVRMRDAVQIMCERVLNGAVVIVEPPLLEGIVNSVDVTCFGAADGSITISGAAGGTGTYQYSINGGSTWHTTSSFSNLSPAVYDVRMRDAVNTGCVIVLDAALEITQPAQLSAALASTDVTCYGAADGEIVISSPAGGYGTYEYTVNGGGSWQADGSFTGLGPGIYNVQMRDAAQPLCVRVLDGSLQITQPGALNGVIVSSAVTCNGADDGVINITSPTGGSGAFDYSVDGGGTWQPGALFSNLAPGVYDVRMRDAANIACETILNGALTITEPDAITAAVGGSDITCFGADNGTIVISAASGGHGTFDYSIDGGTVWQAGGSFTNLTPGLYTVMIRDRLYPSCVTLLEADREIVEPDILEATVAYTDVTCNGAANGTITVSAPAGGSGTYHYSIDGGGSWQPSGSFNGLIPGSYSVVIRDALNTGCMIILEPALVITQPDPITATVNGTPVSCYGAADASITITGAAGGSGVYEYTIDGGTTWSATGDFTGLNPGYYNVQIRDASSAVCVTVLNSFLRLTEPGALWAGVIKEDITCNGSNDGRILISMPVGGYGTYEYSIDGGTSWQADGTFENLLPDTYNVLIRDAANPGCVVVINPALTITEPAVLSAAVSSTDISCYSSDDGTISVTGATGGYGVYQYSVDGGFTWFSSGLFTGLTDGTYNVQMRDGVNPACLIVLDASLEIIRPAMPDATVTSFNATCYGSSDGSIVISDPAGGYGTYEYSINGGGSWQSSGTFTGLAPGTYNVRIRDAVNTGCYVVLEPALVISQPAVLTATVNRDNVTCYGAADGVIEITSAAGGTGAYEYSIDGGVTWQPGPLFNSLAPGSYNVQIRDAASPGCVIVLNSSLLITEPDIISASVVSVNVTCAGVSDGIITFNNVTGGYGAYEYTIDGGATWQSTTSFTGLAAGYYDLQVRDAAYSSCVTIVNSSLEITEPAVLSATVSGTDVTCSGASNGTISITGATGGYGTYEYSRDGGTTWQSQSLFTGLAPGTYNVMIRDAVNKLCVEVLSSDLEIVEPDALTAMVASTEVTCFGASDGTITISNPQGGYGTYEYTINGGASWFSSGDFINLGPGYYNVQMRDAVNRGCVTILAGSLRITQPGPLTAIVISSNVTCSGAADGTITISAASGGYGTYEYSVDGGATWQADGLFDNLTPATYNVLIRDAASTGCVVVLNPAVTITGPAPLTATVTAEMIRCHGAANGIITIGTPTGGSGAYQFTIDGGTTWQWSSFFMGLAPGIYDVRMRDAVNTGCEVILEPAMEITEPGALSAAITGTDVTCFGGADGTITLSAPAGGSGAWEYSINGGGTWQASGSFTSLAPGTYYILIRDAASISCMVTLDNSFMIDQPGLLGATVTKTDITCNGSDDGTITVSSPHGGSGSYEYSVDGGVTWQGSGTFTGIAPGIYDVRLRDASASGCSVILYPNLVVTEPPLLEMTTSGDIMLDCFGDTDGLGTFYAAGGKPSYSFVADENSAGATFSTAGFNSQSFHSAGAGTITVTVTDANGCSAQAVITITEPALLSPGDIGADQEICQGEAPATITETAPATGGTGTYYYQWQYAADIAGPFNNIAGATGTEYTPPAATTQTVYYRRMAGSGLCDASYSNVVEVLVNPAPVAVLSGGGTICPAETADLFVDIPVGAGPFEIDIENHGVESGYTGGAAIAVSPAVTTTYRILRVTDANGCEVLSPSGNLSGTATVTVNGIPSISSSPADAEVCEYGMVRFEVEADGSALTYQWYVDQGSGFVPLADTSVYVGSATSALSIFGARRDMDGNIYQAVVSGCSLSETSGAATLTVNRNPEITVQPGDTTVCVNQDALFAVTASGTGVSYRWQVNSGSGFTDITDGYPYSGATTSELTIAGTTLSMSGTIYRVIVSGVCGTEIYSSYAALLVTPEPVITQQPLPQAVCEGGTTTFQVNATGASISYQWQFNDGSGWGDISDGTLYTGTRSQQMRVIDAPLSAAGEYRVLVSSECLSLWSAEVDLIVNTAPVVDFSSVEPYFTCGGTELQLNGNPTGGSGVYNSHIWSGEVGPLSNLTVVDPIFNTSVPDTYSLSYRVTDSNGCSASGNVSVVVERPMAMFSVDKTSGCPPLTVNFTDASTGGAVIYRWDFGDGSPIDNTAGDVSHEYVNTTTSMLYYTVRLEVETANGCVDDYEMGVTVHPMADPDFDMNADTICSGEYAVFSSLPGAYQYYWDFGDGQGTFSSSTTDHLYINNGDDPVTYTVRLTTTSFFGCESYVEKNIVVYPHPVPMFTATPATQTFPEATVTFGNLTTGANWDYLWRFGDGSISAEANPVYTYSGPGSYNVTLIAGNGFCSDSVSMMIYINPTPPIADFDSIPGACTPYEATFTNTSQYAVTYLWEFGDGGISYEENPVHTYVRGGVYRVRLTATGPGGTDVKEMMITVFHTPTSFFEAIPDSVYVDDESVRFFNMSEGADYFIWEFGDGDTSRLVDPYHKYMREGMYPVTLHAYTDEGCYHSYELLPGIRVIPAGGLRFSNVFRPNLSGPTGGDVTQLPRDMVDMVFYPVVKEYIDNYKLQIFNRSGVLIFESNDINIGWDGYYKGQLCMQGVYVWYVEGNYASGKPYRKVGDITLLH